MMFNSANPDFSTLLTHDNVTVLLESLITLEDIDLKKAGLKNITSKIIELEKIELSMLNSVNNNENNNINDNGEQVATDWLIVLFNKLFAEKNVELVRGDYEPEYFPSNKEQPARIVFAHGFFASALHEISHWCVAGEERRQHTDFGYWYAPDGRTAAQQQAFELVEIKPQALECLFTLACNRQFRVSQDNLFAEFDTSESTFAQDVYQQALQYIKAPKTLPRDAKTLLRVLLTTSPI